MFNIKNFNNKYYKIPTLFPAAGGGNWQDYLQTCEWLQTDGNAYIVLSDIDTSLIRNANVKFTGSSAFGVNYGTGKRLRVLGVNDKYAFNWFNNTNITSNVSTSDTCIITLNDDSDIITFNAETKTSALSRTYINNPLMLFGFNNSGNYETFGHTPTIFFFETNLFYLIACYVKTGQTYIDNKSVECAAGTPGMYDLINNVFRTNDGTGYFTAGPNIKICKK